MKLTEDILLKVLEKCLKALLLAVEPTEKEEGIKKGYYAAAKYEIKSQEEGIIYYLKFKRKNENEKMRKV